MIENRWKSDFSSFSLVFASSKKQSGSSDSFRQLPTASDSFRQTNYGKTKSGIDKQCEKRNCRKRRITGEVLSLCHKLRFSNSNTSMKPNLVDLRYFKLWILLNQIIWVWNIKGLQHRVLKIWGFKYLSLRQRFNFLFYQIREIFFLCFTMNTKINV